MSNLSVAIIQSDIAWENKAVNYRHFAEQIRNIEKPIDLTILPEMFNVGFSHNVDQALTDEAETLAWMQTQAQTTQAHIIASVMITNVQQSLVNRLFYVNPKGEYAYYDKVHLFAISKEAELLEAGKQRTIITINDVRILLTICFDLRFPVFHAHKDDYDAIVNIASWPASRAHHWQSLLTARAIENQAYVLACNRIGTDGYGLNYQGNSAIVDYNGDTLADLPDNHSGIIRAELSLEKLRRYRAKLNFLASQDDFELRL